MEMVMGLESPGGDTEAAGLVFSGQEEAKD